MSSTQCSTWRRVVLASCLACRCKRSTARPQGADLRRERLEVQRVVLASGNVGKLREMSALLAPLGFELLTQSSLGIPSPEETGTTFLENAVLKARHAAGAARLPAISDDSGIEVDALDGRPGVFSARFAGASATDEENLNKLLAELHGVHPEFRQARYHCVIVFVRSAGDP